MSRDTQVRTALAQLVADVAARQESAVVASFLAIDPAALSRPERDDLLRRVAALITADAPGDHTRLYDDLVAVARRRGYRVVAREGAVEPIPDLQIRRIGRFLVAYSRASLTLLVAGLAVRLAEDDLAASALPLRLPAGIAAYGRPGIDDLTWQARVVADVALRTRGFANPNTPLVLELMEIPPALIRANTVRFAAAAERLARDLAEPGEDADDTAAAADATGSPAAVDARGGPPFLSAHVPPERSSDGTHPGRFRTRFPGHPARGGEGPA